MPSNQPSAEPRLERELVDEIAVEWWLRSAIRFGKERARLRLTQGYVAQLCGVTPQTIGQVERGAIRPTEPLRWLLADAVGMDPDRIWEPMTRDELYRRCATIGSAA